MRLIVIFLFLSFYSCQVDTGFQDLTPENDFNSSFYFNSPAFTAALENIEKTESDTVFWIDRPEYLLPPRLYTREDAWQTTDTFAFEPVDFQKVLNVIVQTAEERSIEIQSSVVSSKLGQISLNGQSAWSVPGKYYLVPYNLQNGKRIYIQINRTKVGGSGFFSSWKYTSNGLWMTGEKKLDNNKDRDVS